MKVGIDLGTSYSSISIVNKEGKSEPVHVSTGLSVFGDNYSLPSAVYVDDQRIIIGQAALVSRMRNLENFKSEFKRDLGRDIPFTLGDFQLLPQDLYREFFIHFKKRAEEYVGEPIDLACISHPANYNSRKKELIKDAAQRAGLMNVVLIDEPTAAAIHYCADKKIDEGTKLLIYDFGGGTFDVALIEYQNGDFVSLTPSLGLEHCGGIDIDRMIFDDIFKKIPENILSELKNKPINMKRLKANLNELSVKAKHHLSYAEHFSEDIEIGFDYMRYDLDRSRFNSMIAGLIDETIDCTRRIIQNANLSLESIDKFLLVGGTSRIPQIRERLESLCRANLQFNVNPELAVSLGAAIIPKKTLINGDPPKKDKGKKTIKSDAPEWLINQLNNIINKS